MIETRSYHPGDLTACLALFDSNVPQFFAPDERAQFVEFLENVPASDGTYLVLAQAGRVVACGGVAREPDTESAALTWGMVDRSQHRQGLGTRLTQARLTAAWAMPGIRRVILATSQHTAGFYRGFGFTLQATIPDGFAPGLDRCDMVLERDQI